MSTYPGERVLFIRDMQQEGMSPDIAKRILRHANTIQRLAALACSSEAADRDQVRCPGRLTNAKDCLCRDYGSYGKLNDHDMATHGTVPRHMVQTARAERLVAEWCKKANATAYQDSDHSCCALARHMKGTACPVHPMPFAPIFNGDPRGACVKLRVPSGRADDDGGEGVCVPTRRW